MKWMLSCRETSERLVRMEHETHPWWSRVPVRIHLLACRNCQRFARQMRLVSRATAAWRQYSEHEDAS